ncbi:MAG: PDZ domain-containing protein [Chitinophagaceae bacterium]|nr:PDZ domain-containing protein [Chitinophagaceae bacterium]
MKQIIRKPLLMILGAALVAPVTLLAQPGDKDKPKDKEKKDSEQIIITRKGGDNEKIVVEVNGDKVTVNGKPIEEYKGDDVSVRRHKIKDAFALAETFGSGNWSANGGNFKIAGVDTNRAMLGVTTEKADKGVEIQDITKESGAAKAGLKEGDIITKIGDKKIETPDDLSKTIKSHKPGDKVDITYLREDKEKKTTAELGRFKGATVFSTGPGGQYNFNFDDMDFDKIMPKIQAIPRVYTPRAGQNWNWSGGGPKLGLSVQDTDDGKGVKVIEVDDESNAAKAGIKEDDVITEVDGKATNSVDEISKIIKENKDKTSVMVKLQRGGKTQNIEVKMPRKIKSADL